MRSFDKYALKRASKTGLGLRDALAKDGTDIAEILGWQTDGLSGPYSPIDKAKAIVNGEFLPIGLHHDGPEAWERLLNMEVGEFFWTHEPFNGENLWYRVR